MKIVTQGNKCFQFYKSDFFFSQMERDRTSLIVATIKELNTQYHAHNKRGGQPLAVSRIKVTFKDEPGEGSGVARSFYTAIAEALLANEKLPNLDAAQVNPLERMRSEIPRPVSHFCFCCLRMLSQGQPQEGDSF